MLTPSEPFNLVLSENFQGSDFQRLNIALEADSFKVDALRKGFKIVMGKIAQIFTSKKDMLTDFIYKSKGDVCKIQNIDVTCAVIKALSNSKQANIAKYGKELDILYKNIHERKNLFTRAAANLKGSDVSIIKPNTYAFYIYAICVQTLVGATSHAVSYACNQVKQPGKLLTDHLPNLNKEFKSGNMDKMIKVLLGMYKEEKGSTTESIVAIVLGIGVLAAIVTCAFMIRVIAFYFYYTRVQLADYFEHQANFLNVHKAEVQSNANLDSAQKQSVINAQKKWAERFMALSEFFAVEDIAAERKVEVAVKEANKDVNPVSINVKNTGMNFF